jgi:Secretion system C-terminal sorting domain
MKKNILSIAAFLGLASTSFAQSGSQATATTVFRTGQTVNGVATFLANNVNCGGTFYNNVSDIGLTVPGLTVATTGGGSATLITSSVPNDGAGNPTNQINFSYTASGPQNATFLATASGTAALKGLYAATCNLSSATYSVSFSTTGAVLPIELTSFTGTTEGNKVNLVWVTASEKNNASIEVERSYDAVHFATVGTLKGHGTTSEVNNYAYTDATATGTIAYYRLKTVEFSGAVDYSQVIGVKLGKGSKLEVGVIATDLGLVTYNSMEEGNATLSVVNLSGQVVAQAQATATEGNNVVPMNLNALANGIYLLQVRTANSTVTKKFVKN